MTSKPLLLIVDDDEVFLEVLDKAMQRRGFDTLTATSKSIMLDGLAKCAILPEFAILDLKLSNGNGLELIPILKEMKSDMVIVMLTGYSSIATAVSAIKMGASNYLSKPVNANEVVSALYCEDANIAELSKNSTRSIGRVTWDHIQKILQENDGNISATARSLGMHRRTLQRKLAKKPKQ